MNQSTRIILVTTAISTVIGVAVCCGVVLSGESTFMIRRSFTNPAALVDLLTIGLFTLPISIPTGLAGGGVAATILRKRQTELPLGTWLRRGCCWGALLGGIGTGLWTALINQFEPEALIVALITAPIGAVTGVFVGVLIGAYCNHVSRRSVLRSLELGE